jgi:riboflavin kinase/FMN adenylyltransferase
MGGLIYGINNLPKHAGLVATQGTFDGVHQGHQHVLNQVINIAKSKQLPSILITFHPHPRSVINPNDESISLLTSIEEKAAEVLKMGIDYVLVLPFTTEISNLSPEQFVKQILVDALNVKTMIVGYDHRFGKHRSGGYNELKQLALVHHFEVQEIPAHEIDEIAISSSRIRKALLMGDLKRANELLGYHYQLSGTVVKGNQLGRTIGFPTANLAIDEIHKLIPQNGVYSGYTELNQKTYRFMLNIGVRPTVDGSKKTIEAYILDFEGDLYDKPLKLHIVEYLREEIRFSGLDALKTQLKVDEINTRKLVF